MSNSSYPRSENTRADPRYLAGLEHAIKSEHGTSSQSTNRIPTIPSQRHSNHVSTDVYINYTQLTQFPYYSPQGPQSAPSHQMAQYQPSSQTSKLPIWDQTPQIPYAPTQPPYLEESFRPSEETPYYVNDKQFARILKQRALRQRLDKLSPKNVKKKLSSRE